MLTRTPQPGLPVYTTDNRRLGKIKSVTANRMTISRRLRRDLTIPTAHIAVVVHGDPRTPSRVNLSLASYEIGSHSTASAPDISAVSPLPDMSH